MLFRGGQEGGTGDGTAAHVKDGWRDPDYQWVTVMSYGDRLPVYVKGCWLGPRPTPVSRAESRVDWRIPRPVFIVGKR